MIQDSVKTREKEAYRKYVIGQLKAEGVPESEWETTRGGLKLLRLPKSEWMKELTTFLPTGEKIVLLCRQAAEHENGYYAEWEMYRLSELPNDLLSSEDLKSLGIELVDNQPAGGH